MFALRCHHRTAEGRRLHQGGRAHEEMTKIAIEPLMLMTPKFELIELGKTPYGTRRIVHSANGNFEGRGNLKASKETSRQLSVGPLSAKITYGKLMFGWYCERQMIHTEESNLCELDGSSTWKRKSKCRVRYGDKPATGFGAGPSRALHNPILRNQSRR